MSQGCDTSKTQILQSQNSKLPKPKTNPNPQTQNPKLYPNPKTQMFWVSFGIGTYLEQMLFLLELK